MLDTVTSLCLSKIRAEHQAAFAKYDDATLADLIDHMRVGENQKLILKKFALSGGKYGLIRAALGLPLKHPGNREYNRAYRARKRAERIQKLAEQMKAASKPLPAAVQPAEEKPVSQDDLRARRVANLVRARAALAAAMAAKRAKSPAVVAVPPAAPVVKADAPQPTKAEQVIEASVLWEKDHLTYSTVTIRLRYDTKVAADELRNILRVLSENGNI